MARAVLPGSVRFINIFCAVPGVVTKFALPTTPVSIGEAPANADSRNSLAFGRALSCLADKSIDIGLQCILPRIGS
jgi:hypothetical protein